MHLALRAWVVLAPAATGCATGGDEGAAADTLRSELARRFPSLASRLEVEQPPGPGRGASPGLVKPDEAESLAALAAGQSLAVETPVRADGLLRIGWGGVQVSVLAPHAEATLRLRGTAPA